MNPVRVCFGTRSCDKGGILFLHIGKFISFPTHGIVFATLVEHLFRHSTVLHEFWYFGEADHPAHFCSLPNSRQVRQKLYTRLIIISLAKFSDSRGRRRSDIYM